MECEDGVARLSGRVECEGGVGGWSGRLVSWYL